MLIQHISESEYKRKVEHGHKTRLIKNEGMFVSTYNTKKG